MNCGGLHVVFKVTVPAVVLNEGKPHEVTNRFGSGRLNARSSGPVGMFIRRDRNQHVLSGSSRKRDRDRPRDDV